MKIQNKAFAGVTMRLHSGKDVTGDEQGIFEIGPEDEFLASTKGWAIVGKADGTAEIAAVPAIPMLPPKLPTMPPGAPEGGEDGTGEDADDGDADADGDENKAPKKADEEIDLDALTREQLEACAEEYGVKIDRRWGDAKLREHLAKELFE